MKSILLSIKPKYVELIASGQKTIEVRKSAPQEVPFKCYIYETKGQYVKFTHGAHTKYGYGRGKVIGEFVCDRITDISVVVRNCNENYNEVYHNDECKGSCLTWKELQEYGKDKPLYGWHISDLKIYDKPKELSEFSRPCSYSGLCFSCKRTSFKKDGNLLCNTKITRPPQSWMHVEDLGEEE